MITSAIQRHGFISERLPAKTGNVSNTYELHFVTYETLHARSIHDNGGEIFDSIECIPVTILFYKNGSSFFSFPSFSFYR